MVIFDIYKYQNISNVIFFDLILQANVNTGGHPKQSNTAACSLEIFKERRAMGQKAATINQHN